MMAVPKTCYLTFRAQEDLAVLIEENIATEPQLEWGGIVIGAYDPDRGRVSVEQIRPNIYVKPYSAWETTTDVAAMATYDMPGRRVCGSWHSHPESAPIRASEADHDTWKRTAGELGELHLGLILAPVRVWWERTPRDSWEEKPAPQIAAWGATPKGSVHSLEVSYS